MSLFSCEWEKQEGDTLTSLLVETFCDGPMTDRQFQLVFTATCAPASAGLNSN